MTNFILTRIQNHIGFITLNRAKALNSLSLEMIRSISQALIDWKNNPEVHGVFIYSNHERAFCAGGDIRFLYDAGSATPLNGSALVEDFFTEEYALNYLVHHYPKPYISLLDGVVMGGGMGIGQAGSPNRLRIVTDRTKMAMPEVNIGFFPDVGASYFLSRCAGEIGTYLGITGEAINAADAIYAELADLYLPSEHITALIHFLEQTYASDASCSITSSVRDLVATFQAQSPVSQIAQHRLAIDLHFSHNNLSAIWQALNADKSPFAERTLKVMQTRSPLMMCVTLEQLRRSKHYSFAECLRQERTMVRHCFNYGEILEGIRALVIDKDMCPQWQPSQLEDVSAELINHFFDQVWPAYAHPLRHLE